MVRRVKEIKAEDGACEWADQHGVPHTKLNLRGNNGWPDRAFWITGGRPYLVEYKAEGEPPRPLQAHIHDKLRKWGYDVEVHTTKEQTIAGIKLRLGKK